MYIYLRVIRIILRKLKSRRKLVSLIVILLMLIVNIITHYEYLNDTIDINIFYQTSVKEKRYMMYRCDQRLDTDYCGGLGDRLKGILSAYLWSLLTNRTFIMKVTRPCNMINLLEPNEVDWNHEVDVGWLQTGELHKIDRDEFKIDLEKIDIRKLKQSKQLLVLHANRNYFETIGKNPLYRKRLVELGFDPDKLDLPYTFRTLYNKLFKLSPHMQRKYDEFVKKARPTPNTKLICAQIRIGGEQHKDRQIGWRSVDFKFQPISNSRKYRNLIRSKLITNETGENYKVFLTTDHPLVYEDFLQAFGRDKLVHNDGPFNHIDFVEISKDMNDCSSIEKAILDFHCLAECDAAVISRSQFGRMGVWLRKELTKDVYTFNTTLNDFVKIEHMKQFRLT